MPKLITPPANPVLDKMPKKEVMDPVAATMHVPPAPPSPQPAEPTLAASRLASLDVCPGFTRQLFETDTSAADDGKAVHAAIETGDVPDSFTPEQKDMVEWSLNLISELAGEGDIIHEHPIHIPFIQKEGYIDLLILNKDNTALVLDFKTGRVMQDHPETNLQFRAYATGVWLQNPGLKSIRLVGAYPRMRIKQEATFTYTDFLATMEKLAEIHVKVQNWPKYVKPNEDCGYCGRASTCPALAKAALGVLQVSMRDLPINLDPDRVPLDKPEVLAYMRDLGRQLEGWIKAVKNRSDYVAIQQGIDIPGYRIATRSGNRSFRGNGLDVLQIINATFKDLGVTGTAKAEDLLAACTPSVGDIEKLVSDNAPPGLTKKKAVEHFRHICGQSAAIAANEDSVYLKRDPSVQITLSP